MSFPQVMIEEVCDLITDGTHYTPPDIGDGVPFLTVKDMKPAGLDLITCSKISTVEYKKADAGNSSPKIGDVLFSKDGTVGKVHVVSEKEDFAVLSSIAILRPNKKIIDADYLGRVLRTQDSLDQAVKKKTGSAIRRIILSDLKRVLIPLPPLDEQKRIAAILDKADAIRRKRQKAIDLTDQLLRSVFLDMFGDPVTNPKGWVIQEIDTVCDEIVDCVNRTAPTVDYATPYKMIRTTNVRNYQLDIKNVRHVEEDVYKRWVRRLVPKQGDIIFTREAPAGEAAIVKTNEKIFLGQRTMHFRPNSKLIKSEYLLHELMGMGIKKQIEKMSAGSTVTHLSVPECKKFKIRIPPIDLQERFGEIERYLLKKREKHLDSTELSDHLFSSLSQNAFRGELSKQTKAA